MAQQLIRLAHSPDPDDAFMFYGIACGGIPTGDLVFEHILKDIQTLNDWALAGTMEVTALSVHNYAYVRDKYALLSCGASMGSTGLVDYVPTAGAESVYTDNRTARPKSSPQGPLVIARDSFAPAELLNKTIAIPGLKTTAFLALQLALGSSFNYAVMMFDQIPDAVSQGRFDAGLVIHENQLTYRQMGLHCVMDLGRWWYEKTYLPLPLGCNVIRRDLGLPLIRQISAIIRASILYGLTNRQAALQYALQFGRNISIAHADEFISMYVNNWSVDYGPKGRKAIAHLLNWACQNRLCPSVSHLDFY